MPVGPDAARWCFDRMLALRPLAAQAAPRLRCRRRAAAARPELHLGPRSLLGSDVFPRLLGELTSTLPLDEYRLCAVLHPNPARASGAVGPPRRWRPTRGRPRR
ncbi:hypothetical protein GCM10014713_16180 [Streptomyces purpureus]|uniref:Uncharacterized protein n=1 Tax=Streptomyces purpureus TaxID=1951 RepID=A0A918H010_9ACTN|nr:hypothetical protein GCM10014713_16180 [Streptomyces purpureus]